jgi:hypothetical protein
LLRSAGDMQLFADGASGVTGGMIKSDAGALTVNVGDYGREACPGMTVGSRAR